MTDVSATTSSTSTLSGALGKDTQVLDMDDFMKIMITELTNQDPFEPMSNNELLNQMSSLQQLQSSSNMTESFTDMMGRLDTLLIKQELSSARDMLGEFVAGTSVEGLPVSGRVTGVSFLDDDIILELDNGYEIDMNDIDLLGAQDAQGLVGTVVMGPGEEAGNFTVGVVESVEVTDKSTMLILTSGKAVPLDRATRLSEDNASMLLGRYVAGLTDPTDDASQVSGAVAAVTVSSDGISLKIPVANDETVELPLANVTNVKRVPETE